MATLKDVAKLACVDVSTVSRALNNTSYVHPETKERVYAAAKELGYHPNVIAQALRQGKRRTIGGVVPRLHLTIFSEVLQGIEKQARLQGYTTLICNTYDDAKIEKESLERLRGGFCDGIIIASTGNNRRLLRDIQAGGVEVVQLIRRQDPELSSVVADYAACGRDAVNFLYGRGSRRIGLINGYLHLEPYRGRYEGYCEAVRALGLEELTSHSDREVNSFRYGYECACALLDENPDLDAIVSAVDVQGLGAIRAVSERGLKIPEQVRVISLTGHRVGRMLETTMSAMELPAFEMGAEAAKMIIERIEADPKRKGGSRNLSFNAELAEREST